MAALSPENTGGSFKSFFGRLCGLLGDDLGHRHLWLGGPNGRVVASTRKDMVVGITGLNGAGAITLTGANVGDILIGAADITGGTDKVASFEAAVSVANQLQQTSAADLSSTKLVVHISRQS